MYCAQSTSAGKRSRGTKVTPGKAVTPSDLVDTPAICQSGTRSAASTSIGTKLGAVQCEDDTDSTAVEPDTDDRDSSRTVRKTQRVVKMPYWERAGRHQVVTVGHCQVCWCPTFWVRCLKYLQTCRRCANHVCQTSGRK